MPTPSPGTPPLAPAVLPARGAHLMALVVLMGALLIVFMTWRAAYEREVATAQARFVARTDEVVYLLRERMDNFELVLRGGTALFATVARPTPQQWRAYASGLNSQERFPAVVGLGFAPYVSHAGLPLLQTQWKESGYGLLEIRPRGHRPYYGPILLLEPRSPENLSAMGFDMYSEPVRRAAMQASLESGEPRLTGPVHLVQDGAAATTGLLLYKPVYRAGDRPATQAARMESMQGWVYMPFRMEGFVDMALGDLYENQRFRIFDVTDGRDQLIYTAQSGQGDPVPAFRHAADLTHFGRHWRVEFDSLPLAQAVPRLSGPSGLQSLLALGVFTSLLMYAIAFVLARTQGRAQTLAMRMTEDYRRSEARFRSAMRYSAIGKALLDSEGRIVESNPALDAIVGREAGSLAGLKFEALFEDDERFPPAAQTPGEQGAQRATRRLHHHAGGLPRHVQLTYAPGSGPCRPGRDRPGPGGGRYRANARRGPRARTQSHAGGARGTAHARAEPGQPGAGIVRLQRVARPARAAARHRRLQPRADRALRRAAGRQWARLPVARPQGRRADGRADRCAAEDLARHARRAEARAGRPQPHGARDRRRTACGRAGP